jgi:hypothetical protein
MFPSVEYQVLNPPVANNDPRRVIPRPLRRDGGLIDAAPATSRADVDSNGRALDASARIPYVLIVPLRDPSPIG